MINVLYGDMLEILPTLEENSFDSCVTDPPYHLQSIVKRFGKKDSAPSQFGTDGVFQRSSKGFMGKEWDGGDIAFRHETWAEVYRVLKPGAFLVAFSGTRTYHRIACAIEDAGFEVRDQLAWVYGCLSEDTEILTSNGWKLGTSVDIGERVAAWHPTTGAITLEAVQETFRAPWEGNLIRFTNDDTDQILTPNHRVYHRPSKRQTREGIRSREYKDQWECAEASDINRWNPIKLPLAGIHDGEGIGGVDYASLLGWVWTEGSFDKSGSGVRLYQSESANPTNVELIDALITKVVPTHKRYDRSRIYTYGSTVREYDETCWYFSGELADRVRVDLPGKHPNWDLLWRMTLSEKRAFWDAAMKGDGSGYDFYQRNQIDLEWAQVLLTTIGMRGKISMRNYPRIGGSLCVTPRNSTELQCRHLRNSSFPYKGDVWCVRVPTGAFVVRRNGKVFITGNSGFPKSHDISKAIDKIKGCEREVIGIAGRSAVGGGTICTTGMTGGEYYETAPTTEEAKKWDGFGTALKPAWEPIVLARKPLEEKTVAVQVLITGTGALNIDACRVGVDGGHRKSVSDDKCTTVSVGSYLNKECGEKVEGLGRWPANLCHDESEEVVSLFPNKTSRFFYSAKANAKDRAGSKHPTVKPVSLMEWLCTLVTQPGGSILDPFAGSGTTGIACKNLGFNCTLIEREKEYIMDIYKRFENLQNEEKERECT